MYNSLIKKLQSDQEYFNNEYKIYRKMIDSNSYEGDAAAVSFTSDALLAFGRGIEEIIKDIKEMKEKENNIILYIKKYEKLNNKKEPFTYYGTKYRTLLKGAENLGKIEKYFNVFFNCDFKPP